VGAEKQIALNKSNLESPTELNIYEVVSLFRLGFDKRIALYL
jgi:hypothetical protein